MSVRICCRDKPPTRIRDPVTVRLVLEDVLVAYITLGVDEKDEDKPLLVEFVNVFGSRESVSGPNQTLETCTEYLKKPLHTSSDYLVFQQITQYMTGIIQSHPEVSLQSMLVSSEF